MKNIKSGKAFRLGSTVMHKLLGIVAVCLTSTIVVAVIAVYQMSNIGAEIEAVAEEDMPLTQMVSSITMHQLEQAVLLERIMRLSGLTTETSPEELQAVEAEFARLSALVDQEIKEGEELAAEVLTHATTQAQRVEFQKVLDALMKIEGEHHTYDKHANEIFELVNAGRGSEALGLVHGIEAEEDALDHELKSLLESISAFTLNAMVTVEEHEKSALWLIASVSVVSAVLGFVLAMWFTRSGVSRPLS